MSANFESGRLHGLDLFSGIGGISLALRPWVRTIAYCEIDRYAQGVLMSRMRRSQLDRAPIWDDVRTLRADAFATPIDIIAGGFPCQDISCAGNGKGLEGERSGLFFEIVRLIGDIRPQFVFLENVPAIRGKGADTVAGRLAGLGYDCRWGMLSAFDMGAPHKRERWWLLAHADCRGIWDPKQWAAAGWVDLQAEGSAEPFDDGAEGSLADSSSARSSTSRFTGAYRAPPGWKAWDPKASERGGWGPEPDICRVVDGLSRRVDRIRSLGNAVVPATAREAFARLAGLK